MTHFNVGITTWLWDSLLFLRFVAYICETCNVVQYRYMTIPLLVTCTDVLLVKVIYVMEVRHTLASAYKKTYGAHGERSMRCNHEMYDDIRANCWMSFCSYLILCIWCHVREWGRPWNCCLVCCTHFLCLYAFTL